MNSHWNSPTNTRIYCSNFQIMNQIWRLKHPSFNICIRKGGQQKSICIGLINSIPKFDVDIPGGDTEIPIAKSH